MNWQSARAPDSIQFRLGCAVWAFKPWVGTFYPPKSQPTNFLSLYGERMLTVEGNTTFYSVPSAEMVAKWAERTPAEFRFCPKLPRDVSHEGALMSQLPAAIAFAELMQGLGPRLGPIMLQLPPRYSPASFSDLSEFLSAWPRSQVPIAVEVRHLDWFKPPMSTRLNALLQRLGVGRVLLDSRMMYDWEESGESDPQLESNRRKPKVPLIPVATADFVMVRYISHPMVGRNHNYLSAWVKQVAQWLADGKQVYFFVHCPQEVKSPEVAKSFQLLLEEAAIAVPPLPWLTLASPPDQLSLF